MKKILIINGHPDAESYCYAIHKAYKKGVLQSNVELKEIKVRELKFNTNLEFGYRKRTELEPDLLEAQKKFNGRIILFGFTLFGGALTLQF